MRTNKTAARAETLRRRQVRAIKQGCFDTSRPAARR